MENVYTSDGVPGRYWHALADGRIQCDLCPRECKLNEGQRGLCFVRARTSNQIVLTTYGRSSGFCLDPIEKKPLNHFLGARSVAFTYNDPVIFLEYAVDVAAACREVGLQTVAVTAGYIGKVARPEFFAAMDAANIDLKAFTESFYKQLCTGSLDAVLDTLVYVKHETKTWLEITTLLIPGKNDSSDEVGALCEWVATRLGPDVPLHLTAFHPDWKMLDVPPTPPSTLKRAREIALRTGLRYVYTGNVHDEAGQSTYCHGCGARMIGRDWYTITAWGLGLGGRCAACGETCPGLFEALPGSWGARREPVVIAAA